MEHVSVKGTTSGGCQLIFFWLSDVQKLQEFDYFTTLHDGNQVERTDVHGAGQEEPSHTKANDLTGRKHAEKSRHCEDGDLDKRFSQFKYLPRQLDASLSARKIAERLS